MNRLAPTQIAPAAKTAKPVEDMLRDIAMVLHLTRKVKASIVEDRTMPTGGRFAVRSRLTQQDLDAMLADEYACV